MTDSIRLRVRKLLALASDAGATDNERAVAMQKAQALIEAHNIELGEEGSVDDIQVTKGDILRGRYHQAYHRILGASVAELYDCRHILWSGGREGTSFWGLNYQIEAAEETFLWIVAQVEDLYRQALKAFDGKLTKAQRAELRGSFKDACAAKVVARINRIIDERKVNRDSRALVVVNTLGEKLNEETAKLRQARQVAIREGFGTGAGWNAGDLVRIQKEVK